jgi:Zn-dependent peptidase ImmA (M78 family)/DNA-binding XRE family transcriptional regulator
MTPHLPEQEIFARRLKQARSRAGLTLRALSEVLNGTVAYPTLANYEAGRYLPSESAVASLSEALRVAPEALFRPFRLQLSEIKFRKKNSFSAKARKGLEARSEEFFEHYFELEELTASQRTFEKPIHRKKVVASLDEAEEFAQKLRESWRLGEDPLPVVTTLLEDKGIKIFETRIDEGSVDGLQARTDAGDVIVLNVGTETRRLNIPRQRLTAVHELGHVVVPIPPETERNEKVTEALVWRFAGAFMLPRKTFESAFGENRKRISLDELIELKVIFGASIMAIMRRADELEMISKATSERFWKFAKDNHWNSVGEPGDGRFTEPPRNARFCSLVRRAASEGAITASRHDMLLKIAGADLMGKEGTIF